MGRLTEMKKEKTHEQRLLEREEMKILHDDLIDRISKSHALKEIVKESGLLQREEVTIMKYQNFDYIENDGMRLEPSHLEIKNSVCKSFVVANHTDLSYIAIYYHRYKDKIHVEAILNYLILQPVVQELTTKFGKFNFTEELLAKFKYDNYDRLGWRENIEIDVRDEEEFAEFVTDLLESLYLRSLMSRGLEV